MYVDKKGQLCKIKVTKFGWLGTQPVKFIIPDDVDYWIGEMFKKYGNVFITPELLDSFEFNIK